jgi:predicted DCC family thiol-disulfide oxidoreductase YuxK
MRERPETSPGELADRGGMVRSADRFARVAFFGLLVNFACIYFFNCAHKRGLTWRDGSAVHWVLWQNRIATIWASWIRMHEPRWLSPMATYGTLGIEAALPVILLFPVAQAWTRRIAILAIFLLHGGIALMITLGPFSYSMMCFSLLLLGPVDWQLARKLFVAQAPSVTVAYDPTHPACHALARWLARLDARKELVFVDLRDTNTVSAAGIAAWRGDGSRIDVGASAVARCLRAVPVGLPFAWIPLLPALGRRIEHVLGQRAPELAMASGWLESPAARFARAARVAFGQALATLLFVTVVVEVGNDNWAIPERYRVKSRPEFMRQIVEYLRLPQGWSMFSPEAPRDDGTIVIDAVLSDGRHIDPRKQRPPDFEAAFHGPWYDDQQWCDWDLRMRWDSSRHMYPYFRDYIARLDRLPSWKQNATIQSFDVYWVNNAAPSPGSTTPYDVKRQLLFSGGRRW